MVMADVEFTWTGSVVVGATGNLVEYLHKPCGEEILWATGKLDEQHKMLTPPGGTKSPKRYCFTCNKPITEAETFVVQVEAKKHCFPNLLQKISEAQEFLKSVALQNEGGGHE